jgi:hypothetical protein
MPQERLVARRYYDLVEVLVMKMSLRHWYFVGDHTTLNTYDTAHSVADAYKIVDAVIVRAGAPAIG